METQDRNAPQATSKLQQKDLVERVDQIEQETRGVLDAAQDLWIRVNEFRRAGGDVPADVTEIVGELVDVAERACFQIEDWQAELAEQDEETA
jgi:hypothetical protein